MVGGIISERWATSFRNDGRLRPESAASGYDWCNEAIVSGSEQLVTAVLSGLEPQPGAVPVRVLWPHGIGQLSERLCCAHTRWPSLTCSRGQRGGLARKASARSSDRDRVAPQRSNALPH